MSCFAGLEEICQPDTPLGPYTWYHLGGPARWLLTPRDEAELRTILARCRQHGVPWRVLGRGANVLVRDEGVDAAIIKLSGPVWEELRWEEAGVYAAAGADLPGLVRESAKRGLAGLENFAGIPGTVGGIIRMNAGGKYGEVGQYAALVRVMDAAGRVESRTAAQVGFAYRHTNLPDCVVLGARFALTPGDPDVLLARHQEIWNAKAAAQPAVSGRTVGCMFKNPLVDGQRVSAGRLIDAAGLKGHGIGGAEISPKHANFIVAHQGATAQNVLDLIALARARVQQSASVELELEVEVW